MSELNSKAIKGGEFLVVKTDFNTISLIRSKIIGVFESLKNKSDKLITNPPALIKDFKQTI
jgi:hypothetical protein